MHLLLFSSDRLTVLINAGERLYLSRHVINCLVCSVLSRGSDVFLASLVAMADRGSAGGGGRGGRGGFGRGGRGGRRGRGRGRGRGKAEEKEVGINYVEMLSVLYCSFPFSGSL